jgi:hypothetical protein
MITKMRFVLAAIPLAALVAACSSTTPSPIASDGGGSSSGDGGPAGGPVSGAADTHCSADGGVTQAVSAASCAADDAGAADAGPDDAGAFTYPPTMFNAEGDDDDCKYHVKWTATPIRQGTDVTFTVTVTTKDGTPGPMRPLPGEGQNGLYPIRAEVYLNDTHPAPNSTQTSQETTPGTYTVGPIRFDASGQWTVRFHFHEQCADTKEDSPHGHAAFLVQLP